MAARILRVSVKPNARDSLLRRLEDGTWRALLKSPPRDGEANAELIGLLARHFGVAKSAVSIEGGAAARFKKVRIGA